MINCMIAFQVVPEFLSPYVYSITIYEKHRVTKIVMYTGLLQGAERRCMH
jgi:hypothetical protein